MEGLNKVIRATHEILDSKDLDIRNKLQALQLLSTTYRGLLELTADGSIVQRAIEKVRLLQNNNLKTSDSFQNQNIEESSGDDNSNNNVYDESSVNNQEIEESSSDGEGEETDTNNE